MNIIGVIPARYGSTRLEGKPLKDICGKPMIQYVYETAVRSELLTQVIVATDDACAELKVGTYNYFLDIESINLNPDSQFA